MLVNYWGIAQAEGFLHFFEGWAVFMLCIAILLGEMWLLARLGGERHRLSDMLRLELPPRTPKDATRVVRPIPRPLLATIPLLVATAAGAAVLGERQETIPSRTDFSRFPMEIGGWRGQTESMEIEYVQALKFNDYIMANFENGARVPVNFYVAWYDSQRAGASAHSPRSCIPGGGWQIADLSQRVIDGVRIEGRPLAVNRVDIRKGDYHQLVYYWFQQRGRVITNEYMVKWYIFWDGLTRNRSDGALVRLTTLLPPGGDEDAADQRLVDFARAVAGPLEQYVPG